MQHGWSGTRDDRQPMFAPSHKSVNAIRLSEGGGQIVTTATKVVLKPLEDRIVVRTLEAEQTTASGLVIPDTAKEKPQEGEVLAVGHGRFAGRRARPIHGNLRCSWPRCWSSTKRHGARSSVA